jgi:hypothetical protein
VWHSLYLRPENPGGTDSLDDSAAIRTALIDILQQHGYKAYDPFAGGTGTPPGLKTFVRHFVAPPIDGWVRVLGEPERAILSDLSTGRVVLHAWIDEGDSGMEVYHDRNIVALDNYLSASRGGEGKITDAGARRASPEFGIEVNTPNILPIEIQQLARDHNVNAQQANKMIDRVTSQLFGKLDRASGGEASTVQAQARALVTGTNRIDWNGPAAQRLTTLASMIPLPANWRTPDFDAVRDAYQAARMLRKNPRAQLLPDERAALNAIPDAIQYQAVYVGK